MFADECTSKGLRISFARVLVEIDVTQDLPKEVMVEDPNGRYFKQRVMYEWLPPYCKKCSMLRHNFGVSAGVRDNPRVI